MYFIRLDDASEYMNLDNWLRIKELLMHYHIKPIVGIIPENKDIELKKYQNVSDFWTLIKQWIEEGWIPAMHGYNHVFVSNDGGINPINQRSEFAGLSLEQQKDKIRKGYEILHEKGINPEIFFAPAHTFDRNTLRALELESNIRIISDTIANDIYFKAPFYYIPQQSGMVRRLPFRTTTFCYHPNNMKEEDFVRLEVFLKKNKKRFNCSDIILKKRKETVIDLILRRIYFIIRRKRKN